ncbi:MAG: hypothetical protein AMXMBFR7_44220 [Planctomycetota bacterium]
MVIGPGTYQETVVLAERFGSSEQPMRLTGDESGQLTGEAPGAVILQPLTLSDPALLAARIAHLEVTGLTFRGPGPGLKLLRCRNAQVVRCTFDGLATGFCAESTAGLRVESIEIKRCNIGASLRGVSGARVAHVTAAGCSSVGVMLVNCGPGSIRNSIFTSNNTNFIADEVSAPVWTSDRNVLTGTTGAWGEVPIVAVAHEWFAASGQDRHSVHVSPAFLDPAAFDLRIDPLVRWGGGLPGMRVGEPLAPAVTLDRSGKPFRDRESTRCCGAYEYPDPQGGTDWKPLAANLEGQGPRQSAGVYRSDGVLVRLLVQNTAGVHELWWDGRDDEGRASEAGAYEVRCSTHDIRVADDGSVGDNGAALGSFNCDNAESVVLLPDGRFVISTTFDEAGIPLRLHAASGAPIAGINLAEKKFEALAFDGTHLYGLLDPLPRSRLVKLMLPGERQRMADGSEAYELIGAAEAQTIQADQKAAGDYRKALQKYEKDLELAQRKKQPTEKIVKPAPVSSKGYRVGGLEVREGVAYVALRGLDLVRRVDLASGKTLGDWPVPGVDDLAFDAQGTLWAISGKDLVGIDTQSGAIKRRFDSGLEAPQYIAAGAGRLAASDRKNARVAVLNATDGKPVALLGQKRDGDLWQSESPDLFTNPRDIALYPDGRLLVADHLRIRCLWPDTKRLVFEQASTFMDSATAHPTRPEYVYSRMGIMKVDENTGAWTLTHRHPFNFGSLLLTQGFVLEGKPFIASNSEGHWIVLWDVTNPECPRFAGRYTPQEFPEMHAKGIRPGCITKDQAAASPVGGCMVRVAPFAGLDEKGNPRWDYAKAVTLGGKECLDRPGFTIKRGLTSDPTTGDFYFLAVTERFNKMVPMWGADGTGVGKLDAEGRVRWFALSSGNNYQSITSIHDGKRHWIMACKSFGGQLDVFDSDGLLLGTGAWGWLNNYQMGFVDMIVGAQSYLRADGKPGAYIEDDMIGRFVRARVDGAETIRKRTLAFTWAGGPAGGAAAHVQIAGPSPASSPIIPKVQPLALDGRWEAWAQAGVVPQVYVLPTVTWGRLRPPFLFDTYRAGTYAAAFAHDGAHLYVCLIVTDDTPHADAKTPGMMWAFDSIELWLEQEQFGIGFTADGKPHLFKYRFHGLDGKERYTTNYALPADHVWGEQLGDVSRHGLGKLLGNAIGRELNGRPGYALMAKIPFAEVKLVGGMVGHPGREGTVKLPLTGKAGEIIRVGLSYDGIETWGREQDFKVSWPNGLMYSDPTRSYPFVFGE